MIRFLGKYTRDNKIVAWKVEDEGVVLNIAFEAIYHEFYFKTLIDYGYKFHNYQGDVTTPDGFSLKDIVECKDYLSESELVDLIDSVSDGILDEKDIVQYFDRNIEVPTVELSKPVDVSIKSREEFLKYIDTLEKARLNNIFKFSHLPINAIADPEVLFTLEELLNSSSDCQAKFSSLFQNNILNHIEDIDKLFDTYGINDSMSDTEKMVNILKGYYQWGIPGLNVKITNISFDLNPKTSFKDLNTLNSASLKYGIYRRSDYKFFSEDCIEGRDYDSLAGDEEIDTHANIGDRSIISIKSDKISNEFTIAPYGYKKQPPRIIIDMLSEDGISATFVADINEAHMYRGSQQVISPVRMFAYRTIDDVFIPMSKLIYNGKEYVGDSVIIRAYIRDRIKKATIKPLYENSFDLMVGIGVSPYFAPMYINKLIGAGAPQYNDVGDPGKFSRLHGNCSNTFRNGFSNHILQKYGTGDSEFNEKPLIEQLEYINEEVLTLESEGKYMVEPVIPENRIKGLDPEYNAWFDEYHANEIGNVNFVYSLLDGSQSIGRLAVGKALDSSGSSDKTFNIIYSLYASNKNIDPTVDVNRFLSEMIDSQIDMDKLFPVRDMAAKGCIKDMIYYKSDMANMASYLLYITKIYRENSNEEIDSIKRHYAFEAIVFDKSSGSKGYQVYKSIRDQIEDDLRTKDLKDHLSIAGDIASSIIMRIIAQIDANTFEDGIRTIKYSSRLLDGSKYSSSVKLSESYYISVRNGSMFTKKYATLYDFCENQFSEGNMKCNYYCVNAAINPWVVNPVKGFNIPEYNLFINYFTMDELSRYPKFILEKIENSEAKVNRCLRDEFLNNNLFPEMSVFSISESTKLAKEDFFLDIREYEDLDSYITRTVFSIKTGREQELAVKNTLLKSDIIYAEFKPYVYSDGVEVESTYYEEYRAPLTNKHVTVVEPRILEHNWFLESNKLALNSRAELNMERIKFDDIPYEYQEYNRKLCENRFSKYDTAYFRKGYLHYGDKSVSVENLTHDTLEDICNKGVAIQINSSTYIINMVKGLLKVRV